MNTTSNNSSVNLKSSTVKIINKLCLVLNNLILANQSKSSGMEANKTSFDLNSSPNVSLFDYLARLTIYSKIDDNTIICALALLDKFLNRTKLSILDSNVYLLILTSLQVSMKMNEDVILRDVDYAFLGLISFKTLSYNESVFIHSFNYECNVSVEEFSCYKSLFE
jgi:phosphate system cyclin PHO80